MESVIKWQTGTPISDKFYIVTFEDGEVEVNFYKKGKWIIDKKVIAWCPLSEIEPYKE